MLDSLEMHNRPPLSPRRWLGPLLLGGVLIILLFIGQWLWLTRMPNTLEAPLVLPAERAPLLTTLLQQRAIVWSVTLSIVTMILAILLAVSPLPWWLQLWAIFGKTSGARLAHAVLNSQAQQSAEEWVAEQAALLETAQAQAVAAGTPDGSTAALDQTGAAASQNPPAQTGQQPGAPPAPGQQPPQPGAPPAAGQQPGAPQPGAPSAPGQQPPQPGAQQPGAPPVPGQQPPQPGAPPVPGQPPGTPPAPGQQPAPPGAPPAPGQQPGLQQLLAQEEKTDLEELTDIGDIMNSFKESDEVSAQLLALSNSLHDIDAVTLVTKSRRIADLLAASNAARHSQISKN